MRGQTGYIVGALGMAVAVLSFAVTLEAEVAPAGPRFDPATVNRTLKGGRLPLIPGASGANPIEAPSLREPKSPRECQPDVAPKPFSTEVAGRCVA